MMQKAEKYLMPMADALSNNRFLVAIRDGFLISTPLIIVGSLFVLIVNFPINGWNEFWTGIFGAGWEAHFESISRATFDMISILTVIGIAYAYAKQIKAKEIESAICALISFLIIMPTQIIPEAGDPVTGISYKYTGTNGIFLAIFVAFLSTIVLDWAYRKGWTIKLPDSVPPAVFNSFAALIPSAIVILLFFLIRLGFTMTSFESAHNFIYTILQLPLLGIGNSLGAHLVYVFVCSFLWMFGINGPAVANSVFSPIIRTLSIENVAAFQAGKVLPHIYTGQFTDFFETFGGGGSTLSLVILMLFICRSQRIKQLAKLSIVPGIFGINEMIIFGLPCVLNPIIAIPFIITPIVNTLIAGFAFETGLVPYTTGVNLPWSTPIGFSGYLSTGSFRAVLLQLVLLVIGCLIYYPFVKVLDKKYLQEEMAPKTSEDDLDSFSLDDVDLDAL